MFPSSYNAGETDVLCQRASSNAAHICKSQSSRTARTAVELAARGPHARPRVLLQVQPVSWRGAGRPNPEQLPASAVS